MAKRMPKEARAAMNRIGMQDPKELERRKKRFRKMAAKYKAQDRKANIKRTAKDVGKELAMEAATFAAGGLAGKALAKGGQAAYKAYKATKGTKKAAKGAQKMLKAGPERKLLMAPRAQAAKKIAKRLKRPGKKRIHTTDKYRDAPLSTPRTRALEGARDGLQKSTEKSIGRLTSTKKFKDLTTGKTRRKGGSANRDVLRRMDDEKQNYLKLKEARKGRKFSLRATTSEARAMSQKQIDALFSRIGKPSSFEYGGKRNQALRDAVAKLGRAPKSYKLNTSGKPPAPKPKAKRKKPAKRKAGAPVKKTESKPVKFNRKRKSYSETRSNRAVKNNPQRKLREAERNLITSKQARRSTQREMNEMQRKGTIELQRRIPGLSRDGLKRNRVYDPENFVKTQKFLMKAMDKYSIPEGNLKLSKARRRAKASAIKPRRRK
jgi:hypothetical protein